MRALTWQGPGRVSVEDVPDPRIEEPTDAIVRITSTAICGSDLHLLDVLGPFMSKGDVLGHEPMGIVTEVGSEVRNVSPGDRVVVPFVISCGECRMCTSGLTTQCERTRTPGQPTGASLYGYTELYGAIPGGQAEAMRVRRADANLVTVAPEPPDEQYLYLSDILPTAWQGVEYAGVGEGESLLVLGLGPVGQLATRVAKHRGIDVVGADLVPERRAAAERHGIPTLDVDDDLLDRVLERTGGAGPDAVLDAVGTEAHGNPVAAFVQSSAGLLPDAIAKKLFQTAGVDRLAALMFAFQSVRRGGTVSITGVYGGVADPFPMLSLFDKQVTLRMGQANVQRWIPEVLPLVEDAADPLGVRDLATHRAGLEDAPELYDLFKEKQDGCIKVVLSP